MKKRIAILLLAVLLAASSSTAALAAPGPLFSDLPEDHWSHQYVADLHRQGVVKGYPDGTFQPLGNVTWGEAFKLILLSIGVDEPGPAQPGQHWAMPYVELALENRLMYSFDPSYLGQVPTRLSVARMTARALDFTDISGPTPYDDCEDGYVVELFEKGIMDGFLNEDGSRSFRPDKPISREEMATIVWRVRNSEPTKGMIRFNNYYIDKLEDVPASPFTGGQFSRDDSNRLVYSGGYFAQGIDVSGHKGIIDWEAVAADGIDFAIIRAGNRAWGTGVLMEDSKFVGNMEGAIAAGLDVGAYYFSNAITVAEAEEEAEAFLARLEPYKEHITYPVVCDWEYLGGNDSRAYGVDGRIITQCIDAFCKKVAEAGYTPMIYFNEYCGYIKMDLSKLTDYQFWFAQYSDAPSCFYDFQFWQYSSKGKVAGIGSAVDMNLCFVPYGKGLVDIPEPGPEETEPVESDPVETAPVETDPADPAPEDSGMETLDTVIIDAPPVPAVPPAR
jgi:GH25 family lysozyme M1 (1,4-beta-N-acetylmuramidase)